MRWPERDSGLWQGGGISLAEGAGLSPEWVVVAVARLADGVARLERPRRHRRPEGASVRDRHPYGPRPATGSVRAKAE